MSICDKCNHRSVCGFQDDTTLSCNHFQEEVVRCKACRQWHKSPTKGFHYCMYTMLGRVTKPDDFCSYGEKGERENEALQ